MKQTLRIALADKQHQIWAHWMRYQFSCCVQNADGSLTIPSDKVERWKRQIATDYCNLSPKEQESDIEQADKIFDVIEVEDAIAFQSLNAIAAIALEILGSVEKMRCQLLPTQRGQFV